MLQLANRTGVLAVVLLFVVSCIAIADERVELEYAPGPVANPLKGLVPYASDTNVHFPHSLEFGYVGSAELMLGYDEFDWKSIERLLAPIAGRRMGYDFHVSAIQYSIESNRLKFTLEIQNRGVAPFYFDWKGTNSLISKGKVHKTQVASRKLTGILPDKRPKRWSGENDLTELPKGNYTLALRVPSVAAPFESNRKSQTELVELAQFVATVRELVRRDHGPIHSINRMRIMAIEESTL